MWNSSVQRAHELNNVSNRIKKLSNNIYTVWYFTPFLYVFVCYIHNRILFSTDVSPKLFLEV